MATTWSGTSTACCSVDRVTAETQKQRGVTNWVYSLDFNEKCPNVDYLLDFLTHREGEVARRRFDASSTSSSQPRAI